MRGEEGIEVAMGEGSKERESKREGRKGEG